MLGVQLKALDDSFLQPSLFSSFSLEPSDDPLLRTSGSFLQGLELLQRVALRAEHAHTLEEGTAYKKWVTAFPLFPIIVNVKHLSPLNNAPSLAGTNGWGYLDSTMLSVSSFTFKEEMKREREIGNGEWGRGNSGNKEIIVSKSYRTDNRNQCYHWVFFPTVGI